MGVFRHLSDGKACCTGCGEWKQPSDFAQDKRKSLGITGKCKACICAYNRERYKRMPEHVKKQTLEWEQRTRRARLDGPTRARTRMLWHAAKSRARQKNILFDLNIASIHDRMIRGVCERSGLPFNYVTLGRRFRNPLAPSVDRIDNSAGYIDSNIQLVCNMFNYGKGISHEIDFIAMCVAVAERYADDPAVIERLKELRNAEF